MLKLTSTACVTADIEAPKVWIEDGAAFNGKCKMSQQKSSFLGSSEYISDDEGKIKEWIDKERVPVE